MHGFTEESENGSENGVEVINARWRTFFTRWYDEHGTKSLRVHELAPLAKECGFDLVVPSETWRTNAEGATPSLSRFGMLLRNKHRDVHADLRLISDRIQLGWSNKTAASTYHLEPRDQPKVYITQAFAQERGQSEE